MALGTGFWLVFIVLIGFSQTAKDIYSGLDGVFYDLLFRVKPKTRPFEKLVVVDVRDELQELRRSDYARLINQLIDG
ncbi:hypothetical protein GWO43_08515, partial [candidate division KSB1 bacterium]|nr:hypothetical protein [candidate division KSB1 bacterium]NIS23998.1 hypothetical protein [candidate division KSB1 bacterium]NIT70923.1 hypothetical protein [candidate division KSB1 bacterium]NIU24646.1 hypothetical protein [candidate division KSB1 bacterium]NIW18514.1 hypothetical protein [candidate division KSB1 bacterium]